MVNSLGHCFELTMCKHSFKVIVPSQKMNGWMRWMPVRCSDEGEAGRAPPGLSAVCQCLTGSGQERIKGVGLGGGRVAREGGGLKGVYVQGLVWSDVNGLLLGRQQAVHSCRHGLHVDL